MSEYYKPNRNPNWNYNGQNWRLSRSKIDLFIECPRCFYIDNKLGVARPPGFPFALNSAVDYLLKKEFDVYRANGTPHPLMKQYGVKAHPFSHPRMDVWRENFKGIQHIHIPTGFTISGAIDDVWENDAEELIIVDYKSTSKDEKITELNKGWQDGYKRQMEIYQWLMRQNTFKVSNTGYFVYANALKDRAEFNAKLEFSMTLIPYVGNTDWIEGTLLDIKKCLDASHIPNADAACDYCRYRDSVEKVIEKISGNTQQKLL